MKKTLILVLISVFLMIPLASFAKTALSDSELSTVTGQAGISIDFNSIISNIFSISWGVPTNGSSMNHHHPILTFFKHLFPTNTGGIYVPSNGGLIITITAH
jgi:hypothetical protein